MVFSMLRMQFVCRKSGCDVQRARALRARCKGNSHVPIRLEPYNRDEEVELVGPELHENPGLAHRAGDLDESQVSLISEPADLC